MISRAYTVMALDCGSGPATVAGKVSQSTINAVERCTFWPLTHVGEKIIKAAPSLADHYASSAIQMIFFVFRIFASSFHILPRYPSRRQRFSVLCYRNAMAFPSETAARGYLASFKCIASDFRGLSTVALTKPSQVFALFFGQANNDQIGKSLARKFVGCHSHIITCEMR